MWSCRRLIVAFALFISVSVVSQARHAGALWRLTVKSNTDLTLEDTERATARG
jgi:hypothetical protein